MPILRIHFKGNHTHLNLYIAQFGSAVMYLIFIYEAPNWNLLDNLIKNFLFSVYR